MGGADADFGMDDLLAEVKCTKEQYPIGAGSQVLAYALLSILEAKQRGEKSPYRRIGIYSARFGALGWAEIKALVPHMQTVQRVLQSGIQQTA